MLWERLAARLKSCPDTKRKTKQVPVRLARSADSLRAGFRLRPSRRTSLRMTACGFAPFFLRPSGAAGGWEHLYPRLAPWGYRLLPAMRAGRRARGWELEVALEAEDVDGGSPDRVPIVNIPMRRESVGIDAHVIHVNIPMRRESVGVDAHVIHEHLSGERRGAVGRSGP
jgi:hypothetical protein